MIDLALIPFMSVVNRLRGMGYPGKWLPSRSVVWFGLILIPIMYYLGHNWVDAAICGASYAFWGVFGWGEYADVSEKANAPEDPTTDLLMKWLNVYDNPYKHDVYGMGIRMAWPIIPMSVWFFSWAALVTVPVFGAFCALGAKYTANGRSSGWERQEYVTGTCWGALLWLTLWI